MKLNTTPAMLLAADILAFALAFLISYSLAKVFSTALFEREFILFALGTKAWLWIYAAAAIASLGLFCAKGHYTQRTPWWEQVKYVLVLSVTLMLLTSAVLYFLKVPFSRMWVLCCFSLCVPSVILLRLVARKIALKVGRWGTNVTILGGTENVLETVFALNSDSYNLYHVNEIFVLGAKHTIPAELLPDRQRSALQKAVAVADIEGLIRNSPSNLIVVAPDSGSQVDLASLAGYVEAAGKVIAFVPPMDGMSLYGMDVQHFFGSHTVLLQPKRKVEKPLNRFLKRTLDLVGAVVGLILLSVPILVIGMIIRKDGGSVFYFQRRVGRNGKLFKCWKLRSMVPNSKEVLEELLATDPQARKEWETDFKLKNDPRITKIGHIIRKTSIDELPQLWNVIKGDMSLVGPRPIVTDELEYYGKHAADYLAAKPGLTGLWQVSGRNDTSYAYRVYLDSWYVAHWSVWTDIVIIVLTIGILVNRKGAY